MGTKRSALTDENELPLSVVISGANTHDIKLLGKTLDHIVVPRPKPDEKHPQNLCLDAGYTGSGKAIEQRDYIAFGLAVRRRRSWNETLTFAHDAGSLRLHTLFLIVFANFWFVMKKG